MAAALLRLPAALSGARLAQAWAAERDRLVLWTPVLLAIGIAVYFALPVEPAMVLLLAPAILFVLWWGLWPQGLPLLRAAVGITLIGFAAAAIAVSRTHTLILTQPVRGVVLGRVEEVEPGRHTQRLVVAACSGHALVRQADVRRADLILRTEAPLVVVGDVVRFFAALEPLPPPRYPGGFDRARRAWLAGIGARGYALGPVTRLEAPPAGCARAAGIAGRWLQQARRLASRLRLAVAGRIVSALPADRAGLAVALLTGHRGWLARADIEAMRDAGLAHLLAISGLHLGLVAAGVFALVRLLLAAVPRYGESRDGKRPAAVAALAAISLYLMLSGASLATTRAFIMTALALSAVIMRRDPFSLRLLAFAAVVMLLRRPSDLLHPGFQMSFLAVAALLGVYELWRRRAATGPLGDARRPWPVRYLAAVLATTAVAELAIAPAAIHHFGAVARYGLLANIIAVPATAFIVMPAGLLALAAMPFGLEGPALWVMGAGAKIVLETAHAVAGLPDAVWRLPHYPAPALLLIVLAMLHLFIWRRPALQLLSLLPAAAAAVVIARAPLPDVLVGAQGRLVAVRAPDLLWVNSLIAERGSRRAWQEALGLSDAARWDRPPRRHGIPRDSPLVCHGGLCVAEVSTRLGVRRIGLWRQRQGTPEPSLCDRLDVLVIGATGVRPDPACRPRWMLVTADDLARRGVHAFFIDRRDGRIRLRTVADSRGRRPWSGAAAP